MSLATEELRDLALDLRWAWRPEIRALFRAIDPDGALTGGHDPFAVFRLAPSDRLDEVLADPQFQAALHRLAGEQAAYVADGGWFGRTHGRTTEPLVAYFSAEIGLDEALPLYSGGLGVLAGDHLKSASALGVPLVGVSLLYAEGYFRQQLDAAGWQHEYYPPNRFDLMPIERARDEAGRALSVGVPLPGRTLELAVWRARIGRVVLLLLDANVPTNGPADRGITGQLYGGDRETRLQQEMALGIGGWRALAALGLRPPVCHLNEGHAAFAVLERARDWMTTHGTSLEVARVATAAGNVFTTHTPVAAGFDAFEPEMARRYLAPYAAELGLPVEQLLDLGRRRSGDERASLEMAVLALRSAGSANGVSRLHGAVSRRLFADLFPRWPEHEVPIGSVTNGVHVATWVSDTMRELWQLCYGEACWDQPDLADWARLDGVPDEALWAARARERSRLVSWARGRLAVHLAQRGATADQFDVVGIALDPDALTIGFARRFAEYKRPALLLGQPDRLRRLLTDPDRPVQLVIAGKAHPRDEPGKALIAQMVQFANDPAIRRRVVFLEDYDLEHAAHLVAGVDLWLNTPRYPLEASGTSGMKVLVNGGLNFSEFDGWWAEAYEPALGWTLAGPGEQHSDDAVEADRLYGVLESEIVPAFYDRDPKGLPRAWLARVRASMTKLTPRFSSNRMVAEYVERHYLPAAERIRTAVVRDGHRAAERAALYRRLRDAWPALAFGPTAVRGRGETAEAVVPVRLGDLRPAEVAVQFYRDPGAGEDPTTMAVGMRAARNDGTGWTEYVVALSELAGPLDRYTARALPTVTLEDGPLALPLIAWQA